MRKSDSSVVVLLYERSVPTTLIASLRRSIHFIPKAVNGTPSGVPVLAILYFVRFSFNPEKKTEKSIEYLN